MVYMDFKSLDSFYRQKMRHVYKAQIQSEDNVTLDARLFSPEKGKGVQKLRSNVLIVLVHQYSVLGGQMDLMRTLAHILQVYGYHVLIFNMRGVGASTGSRTLRGISEVSDVVAAAKWGSKELDLDTVIVGSSAGAPIAGSALADIPRCIGYVGIGYTFGKMAGILFGSHYSKVDQVDVPKLFIMGTKDGFTTVNQLDEHVARQKGKCEVELVQGVGHFQLESPAFDEQIAKRIDQFVVKHVLTHSDDI